MQKSVKDFCAFQRACAAVVAFLSCQECVIKNNETDRSADAQVKILKTFEAIWGVGRIKAEELYDAGFCTIEDVRARGRGRLSTQQLIGLKRWKGFFCIHVRAAIEICDTCSNLFGVFRRRPCGIF